VGTKILIGDVMARLAELPDESVHCVVTSPPYFGLRDYGTATWEGGDPGCDHARPALGGDGKTSGLNAKYADDGSFNGKQHPRMQQYADQCRKCGARRVDAQLGLEATPEEHVERMVEVFRAVRRCMRKDATLWMNYGDVYYSDPSGFAGTDGSPFGNGGHASRGAKAFGRQKRPRHPTLKPKDLVGMPWRVAFALQADGWWLRSDIIWAKPNPMPESVTDRPTKSHEHLFLLAKSATYHYDADAVREPSTGEQKDYMASARVYEAAVNEKRNGRLHGNRANDVSTRNLRDVWTIPTEGFPGAHFATFPTKLVEPCIKAGCPEGGTVLDPFGGAGTVGLVADRLRRNAVLIELNPEYARMAEARIRGDCPMFAEVESA